MRDFWQRFAGNLAIVGGCMAVLTVMAVTIMGAGALVAHFHGPEWAQGLAMGAMCLVDVAVLFTLLDA